MTALKRRATTISWAADFPRPVSQGTCASGDAVPAALAEKNYSGEFRVRIPPLVHRNLALLAAEQRVSLSRLASAKLAA